MAERLYKCNNYTDNVNTFIRLRSTYRHELITYTNLYYNNKLHTFTNNPRKTFKIEKKLLYKNLKALLTIFNLLLKISQTILLLKPLIYDQKKEINLTKLMINHLLNVPSYLILYTHLTTILLCLSRKLIHLQYSILCP